MLLEAKNINKQFAKHKALDDVSISIPENSIFGLLGPNGAGKTTLIRIINQITAPDTGEVLFKGKPLKREDISRIGYLPEERGLYKKMKVGDQSIYLAQLKGLSKSEAKERLKYWFDRMHIMPWWDKKVQELSKGMAQKVQFVTTVLHNPELLIFDEPFSGFDPINTNLIKKEILDLKAKGTTIIFSAHDMPSVEEVCDHIALINNSKVILEGNIHSVKEKYKENNYQISYTGDLGLDEPSIYKTLHTKITDYTTDAVVKIVEGRKNEMLRLLADRVNVKEFKEIIPSMNEVFIKAVEENNALSI
ncbi:ABC-2 type transport system ATP-binding protein [Balneicella halophila]|uniref:ABC-2 type transport system ATP-binding protein n=1 Tax=Balneicella halophila TaxID=1537566 RepID=A0A7L4US82_BALHA|nr:ABC transporter ATP-binding protein [Balneicella halophila]PVX52646.1 ABC-2 type transport system ATP-binding protein [Balneicella halophila]